MVSCGRCVLLLLLSGIVPAVLIAYLLQPEEYGPFPENGYWGPKSIKSLNEAPPDDTKITKFSINVNEAVLTDLKERLRKTRFVSPLEGAKFNYGFNSNYLKQVVDYWINKYDWRKQEKELNAFEHYTTQIEGIRVHYMHVKPKVDKSKVTVIPLLMTHGWPGSVVEFTKIIPLLTQPKNGIAFEMICPSIPGYGFSEAPYKTGFTAVDAARIFVKLMDRLGHKKFLAQGGDWGAMITSIIGAYFPDRLYGIHVNVVTVKMTALNAIKYLAALVLPSLFSDSDDISKYPISKLLPHLQYSLREFGYMHIQATKPDTVGTGLNDSPAGLAAYLLEKFAGWTNEENFDLDDGGLTRKYSLDHLLTNVMVYWVTNSITSSARFYKENISSRETIKVAEKHIDVPAGLTIFPEELMTTPKMLVKDRYRNLKTFTYQPRGGHFAAMEEPELLEQDIRNFVDALKLKAT